MALCPACHHQLSGMPGAPVEEFGRFTAEVRCPECAQTVPAGVHVLHGSSEAAHWVKDAPFHVRAWAWVANGMGCGALMLHFWAGLVVLAAGMSLLSLARGEISELRTRHWVAIVAAVALVLVLVRFWWRFRSVSADGALRADQVELGLLVAADWVCVVGHQEPLKEVRSIRVIEHIDSDDDEVVASVVVDATAADGSRSFRVGEARRVARPLFMPIPRLSAHRVSALLMATFRGRADGVQWVVPSTIEGIDVTPIKGAKAMPVIAMGCTLMLTVPVLLRSLSVLLPTAAVVLTIAVLTFGAAVFLVAAKSRPPMKRTIWVVGDQGVSVMRPGQRRVERGGRPRGLVPRARLERLEVRRERGLPYLELVGAGNAFMACTNSPDDWGGLSPEEYAERLSARLGIPWSVA